MKNLKSFISVILALLMVLSGAPISAYAAGDNITSGRYISPDGEDYNIYWEYNDRTDTLYLDGRIIESLSVEDEDTGEYYYYLPIYVEENGVEYLVENSCHNIVFGKNVECLGTNCLGYDDGYYFNVSFESGNLLDQIWDEAFYGYHINNLKIPNCVTVIGSNSFKNCDINYIRMPSYYALNMGSSVFENANIGEIYMDNIRLTAIPSNTFYNATIDSISLPRKTETIGRGAFANSVINCDLELPEPLETIDTEAFLNARIKSIEFPLQITKINARAFKNCTVEEDSYYSYNTDETTVHSTAFQGSNINVEKIVPESEFDYEHHNVSGHYTGTKPVYDLDWSYNASTDTLYLDAQIIRSQSIKSNYCLPLTYISESGMEKLWLGTYHHIVFSNNVTDLEKDCLGITNWAAHNFVTVDFEEGSKLEWIATLAFQEAKVKNLILPDSVYAIDYNSFKNSQIEYIKLPHYTGDEETELGEGAFYGCTGIEIDWNGFNVETLKEESFSKATLNNFTIPSTVKTIERDAFLSAKINGDLRIPNSVETICDSAFWNIKVNNLYISKDFETIEEQAFESARVSGTLYIEDNVSKLSDYMFENLMANKVYIGKSIKNIPKGCFSSAEVANNGFEFSNEITGLNIGENAFRCSTIDSFSFTPAIASIETNAFYSCNSLKRITAQDNCVIESLPEGLFSNCIFIESVEIPASVKTLDKSVFNGCSALSQITFKSGSRIEEIGGDAFRDMTSLESFMIPASVKKLGASAFKGCTKLSSITFENGSQLEEIEAYCFQNDKLIESVVIPASVKLIGNSAFNNCEALSNVTFVSNNRLEKIDTNAFAYCHSLASISLENCRRLGELGSGAFYACTKLSDITFSRNGALETIGSVAFGATAFEHISLPNGLITLSNEAFAYCSHLERAYLPTTLETLGEAVFYHCSELTSVNIPDEITEIPNNTFNSDTKLNITIPSTITAVGDYAFYQCINITSIPSSIISFGRGSFEGTGITEINLADKEEAIKIDMEAFRECKSLTSVNLANTTLTGGSYAFYDCTNLTTLVMPDSISLIPSKFLCNTKVGGEIVIPENTTRIGDQAFASTNITKVNIPSKCTVIGSGAFAECTKLTTVTMEETGVGPIYYGVLGQNSVTARYQRRIGDNAFANCTSLSKIDIALGTSTIGRNAFSHSGITSLTLPSSVTTISEGAFECTNITTVAIPDYITSIEPTTFKGCELLKSVTFSENSRLQSIGESAFHLCRSLEEIEIPSKVTGIGPYAFNECNLERIVIPEGCKSIQGYSFGNNPLKIAIIMNPNLSITARALFWHDEGDIISPTGHYDTDGVIYGYLSSTAQTYADANGINFTPIDSIEDPEEIEVIDVDVSHTYGTWQNGTWRIVATASTALYIEGTGKAPTALTDIAGIECSILDIIDEMEVKTLYLGDGITSIPDYFMYDEEGVKIEYVRLPDSLKSIGKYAFAGTSVISLYNQTRAAAVGEGAEMSYIPKGVNYIGEYAFANTKNLSNDFILPKELTEISEGLFYNSNVPHVEMYGKVTKLGKKAFAECANMTTLYVPSSVTEIYTDGNVDNNAFGYVNSTANTNLWVNGRNNSAAAEYCNQNNINFANVLGLPYRSGYFRHSNYDGNSFYWDYYIEDNTVILKTKDSSIQNVNSDWKRVYEDDSDTNTTSLVLTINSESDLQYIDIKPDKVIFDGIYEFTAPNFLAVLNPKEIVFNNFMRKFGARTFANCTRLETIELPSSVSSVGPYSFENCTSLKQVRLGYGMSYLAEGLFSECRNLESVDLGNVVLQSIFAKAFYNCNSLKFVNLSNAVSLTGSIGEQAFYNCVNLQEINIPGNIKTIKEKAFYNCVQVQSLNISGNVESIGKDAFANLLYCESVTVNSEVVSSAISGNKSIFENLGAYTNGIELNLGDGVNTVDFQFFDGLNITSVNFGSGVNTLENKQCLTKLKAVTADSESIYTVKNNCLYSGNCLVLAPQKLTQISIAPATTSIAPYALYGTGAKSITLPNSVNALGEYCFASSNALVGITLSDNISEIPANAFKDCVKLRLLNLPESTFIIRSSAFEGCTSLVSVLFNNSLYTISDNAFKGCSKLEGLAFPEGLNYIGNSAFESCTSLKYAYIWYATIGKKAFAKDELLNIFTPAGSDAYRYAREYDFPYSAYTDEELFYDEWAIKVDALAGYLGYCEEDGHGDIQYLTVYEADCENDGFIIGVCEYCSEILDEIHINATGHRYRVETEIPATATTRGITVHTCQKCSQSYTEYTAPLDESFAVETHTVSGTIELASNRSATQGIAPAKNASIVIDGMVVATTNSDGAFSFELETGAYEAQIKYAYGFTRNIYIVISNRDIEYAEPIVIIGCDFSKDGVINDEDVTLFRMVISARENDPSYLSFVDLNADGYINAKDYVYMLALNGLEAQNFKYPQLIIS